MTRGQAHEPALARAVRRRRPSPGAVRWTRVRVGADAVVSAYVREMARSRRSPLPGADLGLIAHEGCSRAAEAE